MSFLQTPEDLLQYFENLSLRQPHELHWRRGAETTRFWIQLMASVDTMQGDDLKRLLRIVAQPDRGSGWYDLSLRVQHWVTTLPPLFQAEAMAAYFAGLDKDKLKGRDWQHGYRSALAWKECIQQDAVPLHTLETFVIEVRQKWLFCEQPPGYLLTSMIDKWLENTYPTTTLRIIPPR